MSGAYLFVRTTRRLHREHSRERCNLDAARRARNVRRIETISDFETLPPNSKTCAHCIPDGSITFDVQAEREGVGE